MKAGRFILATFTLLALALVWNGIVHFIILRSQEAGIASLLRSDAADKLWLSLLGTLCMMAVFIGLYQRWRRSGSLKEGLQYGLVFGFLAGVLVDLNQYVLFPVPATLAALWFLFGLMEFSLYGMVLARIANGAAAIKNGK